MAETQDEITSIESEIRVERAELGKNLDALERKMKGTVDWREQFDRHPTAMVSAAFAAGLLLSRILPGRHS